MVERGGHASDFSFIRYCRCPSLKHNNYEQVHVLIAPSVQYLGWHLLLVACATYCHPLAVYNMFNMLLTFENGKWFPGIVLCLNL